MSWAPDYTHGKLTIGSYVIPNHAVMFVGDGPLDMWFPTVVGSDVEVIDATVTYPRVEKAARGRLELMVNMRANKSGTSATNRVQQLLENIAELSAALNPEGGKQTVAYEPWIGSTSVNIGVLFEAPILGRSEPGVGAHVAVPFVIEAGAVTNDGA